MFVSAEGYFPLCLRDALLIYQKNNIQTVILLFCARIEFGGILLVVLAKNFPSPAILCTGEL